MNKEEIKKALVLCQMSAVSTCRDCPYTENCDGTQLYKDALDLITEQEKEIERLKADNKNLKDDFDSLYKDYEFVRDCDAEHCLEIEETVKQAKIDVLKKLRSRMADKESLIQSLSSIADVCLTIEDIYTEIDKLLAEVRNEQ